MNAPASGAPGASGGGRRALVGLVGLGLATALAADVAARLAGPAAGPSLLGRLHPLVVHLPLGVTALAATLEIAALALPKLRETTAAVRRPAVGFAFASAVLAVLLGALLARVGGVPAATLGDHRTLALVATLLLGLATLAPSFAAGDRAPAAAVLAAMGALGLAGHLGGTLTHGEGYLTAALTGGRAGAPDPAGAIDAGAVDAGDATLSARAVAPILAARCGRCHGADKQKGGLRVDSLEALARGGKHGPAFVAGRSDESLLVTRARLPASDEHHMPPEDEPPLGPGELEVLALWIDRGASPTLRVADVLVPAAAAAWLAAHAGAPAAAASPGGVVTNADGGPPSAPSSAPPDAATDAEPGPDDAGPRDASPAAPVALAPKVPLAYRDRVAPVLAAKCGKCHGAAKAQGKLRTDSLAALLRGGASGPAIVRSAPAKGELLARVRLPTSDEDHMPPEGKGTPLTAGEVRLLERWIALGASAELPASALSP